MMMITFTVPEENERTVTAMAEYIEREDAIDAVLIAYFNTPKINLNGELFYNAIRKLQPADVEPVKRGRWIKESDGGTRCSACNKRVRDVTGGLDEPVDLSDMPYCPKCGARMNEEGTHER